MWNGKEKGLKASDRTTERTSQRRKEKSGTHPKAVADVMSNASRIPPTQNTR